MAFIFEFHISRHARDRYQFDETLFATDPRDGGVVFSNFGAARRFADRIYAVSGQLFPASELYAIGLMDEIMHILIRRYESGNPGILGRAFASLAAGLGGRADEALTAFTEAFPPTIVYRGQFDVPEYLAGSTASYPHRQIAMEEMLLLSVANRNPAIEPYAEFFDESVLQTSGYPEAIRILDDFFSKQPPVEGGLAGTTGTLYQVLLAPALAAPYSLEGQLQYLLDRWGEVLGADLRARLLRAMDLVREEVVRHTGHGDFAGSAPVPSYGGESEYERYSADQEWMARLVLIAKNTYVWLEQLSRKYQRWIRTLDQIPDEDLDILASQGFTGLWLIGLWERSRASQRMKQRMGQQDAVASAYSLYSYDIAAELGGWDALANLRARAAQRGIRLSADMVPNHMGIDSAWVIEHPDWFLSLDHSPYPSYSFQSENLADDPHTAVILEDHYYTHTDAAVVFQRRSIHGNDVRYIYHGNDGTSFPWNDTAQLDYSKAYVREAVIQTILHVARNFPIIRFDAAMTLAKRHIQRLWFPAPGEGGAIPSRAEHGMTRAEFEACMPNEFWREVVDRVAAEVPDTLLLAEAFWLMEGYFVRTLGMHRVYNSAFMHMLRDEDNAKYRLAIKNTLEFDPQILKRYVNFMNNPDEKTAMEQFGNGDKYFGVCTVLATLPGLPMFGHGQIEGYREKYGMEFRMPRWDEQPDEGLLRGHEWKIFPLLHRRHVFAGVEHFLLYDLFRDDGHVDENVFAYSNRSASGERGLIIYHNRFADTRGWIRTSAAFLDKASGKLLQKSLGEGLDLPHSGYAIFRDVVTHLEYIRPCQDAWDQGLFLQLSAYQHHAFLDWRFVDGPNWAAIHDRLQGAGVESIQALWQQLFGARPEAPAAEELAAAGPVVVKKAPRKRAAAKSATKSARKTTESSVKKSGSSSPRAVGSASKASKPGRKKSRK
ncbi:MAG TPA: alpha-amylase family glycosyl hydrolase [Anaerolineales bacterium]